MSWLWKNTNWNCHQKKQWCEDDEKLCTRSGRMKGGMEEERGETLHMPHDNTCPILLPSLHFPPLCVSAVRSCVVSGSGRCVSVGVSCACHLLSCCQLWWSCPLLSVWVCVWERGRRTLLMVWNSVHHPLHLFAVVTMIWLINIVVFTIELAG